MSGLNTIMLDEQNGRSRKRSFLERVHDMMGDEWSVLGRWVDGCE